MNGLESTTVESICNIAGVGYGALDGLDRIDKFVVEGGHRKIPVPGSERGALYIDLTLISNLDGAKERAREILIALAVDLNDAKRETHFVLARLL